MNEVKVLLYESVRLIAMLKILLRNFEAQALLHLLRGVVYGTNVVSITVCKPCCSVFNVHDLSSLLSHGQNTCIISRTFVTSQVRLET